MKLPRTSSLLNDTESLLIFGTIAFVTFIVATLVRKYLKRKLKKHLLQENVDITSYAFIVDVVTFTIYLLGFGWAFLSLPISASYAHSLFASAGASTIILGIAAQQVLGNIIAGVFILFNRPFNVHDIIEVSGTKGMVKLINIYETMLETDNGTLVRIPNSLISNAIIINYTKKSSTKKTTE